MARTALFSRLQSVASQLNARAASSRSGPSSAAISRRHLLRAGVGLGIAGCGPKSREAPLAPRKPSQRVAVIGGGLAGLHCAFWLAQAGADVTVYEANGRVGGRTFTGRGLFPKNLICEFGAEFIRNDHTTMLALALEFSIPLDERYSGAEGIQTEMFWLGGKEVSESVIESQLASVTPALVSSLAAADSSASLFKTLDNTTLARFFEATVPALEFPELSSLLATAFRAEFGLEPDQQSALNLVHLFSQSDLSGISALGNGDQQFRVHGGSDSFAARFFAHAVLRDRVKLNSRLASIRPNPSSSGDTFSMTFETQTATGFAAEAEHVVFALPFSVLRLLDLSPLALSDAKRKVIGELGYGSHSKLFGAFGRRRWRDPYLKSGTVSSDLPFQQVWDASLGQADAQGLGILGNLVGGDAGAAAADVEVKDSMAALLRDLDGAFPGIGSDFTSGSAVRMHWPSAPLFRGSHACYRPGQWALRGNEGRREGNLHFCGEHCSADFQGRMEGAVETGALVAAKILDELKLAWPSALVDILEPKLVVKQPCYDGTTGAALGFLDRRDTLAREALPRAR